MEACGRSRGGARAFEAGRIHLVESALVNAADAVVIAEAGDQDTEPRIVYVNPAFTRMTGYTAQEVLGGTPRMLQGPDSCRASRAVMREAIEQHRSVTVVLVNYRKDGGEYIVEISLTPVIGESGVCTHWIAIERDITERRPAEAGDGQGRVADEKHAVLAAEIRERERAQAQLAYSSVHDDLTGLHNRAHFMRCLDFAIARAQIDPAYTFSIVCLDLDRFKLVNDYLGHRTGDRILRDLARRFEPVASSQDTLARIGGDEFGLLLDATGGPDEALNAAGRLLIEISKRSSFRVDDVVLGASIGIVHSNAGPDDAELMMRDAEIALVHSRRTAGGGSSTVFTPELRSAAAAAARVRSELYGASERGELRMYYQPLADIATGGIYGFEGLMRWQHPVRGLVMPDDFIPAAEETGLIVEIGRWGLVEGCRKAAEFARAAGKSIMMSLNVSSQQLLHPDFLNHLQEALDLSCIDARALQLEVTESVFLAGGAVIGAVFARIRALGIQIAFDDFGTGYSSLSYLERFQIDTLKIDRSFVARIDDASSKSEILRMIISLAHALGVDIVAEGVETRAQRDALGHLGCTHLQGFLYSAALPPAEAAQLLAAACDPSTELFGLLGETLADAGVAVLSAGQRHELREQVEAAITTHNLWITRLHAAVETGESPCNIAEVGREDMCPVGIWLTQTISESLRTMPLYYVTRSRHAVFHRSMAWLLAGAVAGHPQAARSMQPDGDMTMVAASLLHTLHDWLAIATNEPGSPPFPQEASDRNR
jgi:diguanylate cyclase (GGDEF)-like protein/PAS domain S-box-containing protein